MYIADIHFPIFYASAFPCLADAETFCASVESLDGPVPAKTALHQGARMLWLADRMDEVARARDALQILFYLIAAEAVAKIVFRYSGEGESKSDSGLSQPKGRPPRSSSSATPTCSRSTPWSSCSPKREC
jgi:hypothetical protein